MRDHSSSELGHISTAMLQISESRFRTLFEYNPMGLMLLDRQFKVIDINNTLTQTLNYPRESLYKSSFISLLPLHAQEACRNHLEMVLDLGLGGCSEMKVLSLQKEEIPFKVSAMKVPDVEHGFLIWTMFEDLRPIKEQEKEKALMLHNARLSSLGEVASGIAHEINNPLAVIFGKTGLVINQLKSVIPKLTDSQIQIQLEQVNQNLDKVLKSSDRIASIVKNMRLLSDRSEKAEMANHSAFQLVQDVVDLYGEKIKLNQVALQIDSTDRTLFCNKVEISQILLSLINNSLEAMKDQSEKWIQFKFSSGEENDYIHVIDSGNGIDSSIVPKLMVPFFTTKAVGEGTGLGLSVSREIMKKNHGDLFYQLDQGHTSFVLQFSRNKQ